MSRVGLSSARSKLGWATHVHGAGQLHVQSTTAESRRARQMSGVAGSLSCCLESCVLGL
jgi:hypothetical protein